MVDPRTIKQMAHLARLEMSETHIAELSQQLSKILEYFNQISRVNTIGVEPLVTPTEIEPYWRDDKAEALFGAEEMVANAPEKVGNLFKVPPVV